MELPLFTLVGNWRSLLRLIKKGRILIPADIRRKLGLRHVAKMHVEGDKLIIESIEDLIDSLTNTVVKGSKDIEMEIAGLREKAEKEGLKRVRERWL